MADNQQPGAATARIVKDGTAEVAPLYPPTRLFRHGAVEIAELKARAEREIVAGREEGERIVAEARRKAADLIAAAEVEAKRMGVVAEEAARGAVEQRGEALLASLSKAVESWSARYPKDVVAYAFKLARRIVECEFAAHPERVLEFVKSTLEKARIGATGVVIYLHPDDVPIVSGAAAKLAEKLRLTEVPAVVEDSTLQRSSVRVEIGANRAAYHAGVDAAFAELKKQLERGIG